MSKSSWGAVCVFLALVFSSQTAQADEYLFTVEDLVCTQLNGEIEIDERGNRRQSTTDEPYLRVVLQELANPVFVILPPCRAGDRLTPSVSVKTANPGVRFELWEHDGDTIGGDEDAYTGRQNVITLAAGDNVSRRTVRYTDWLNPPGDYTLTVSLTRLCECRRSWWGIILRQFDEWWRFIF